MSGPHSDPEPRYDRTNIHAQGSKRTWSDAHAHSYVFVFQDVSWSDRLRLVVTQLCAGHRVVSNNNNNNSNRSIRRKWLRKTTETIPTATDSIV